MAFIASAGTVQGGRLVSGATMVVNPYGTVTGGLTMSGAHVYLAAGARIAADQTLAMEGVGNRLEIGGRMSIGATISAFSIGDVIHLRDTGFLLLGMTTYSQRDGYGILGIKAHPFEFTPSQTLRVAGYHTSSNFDYTSDGNGGTLLTYRL